MNYLTGLREVTHALHTSASPSEALRTILKVATTFTHAQEAVVEMDPRSIAAISQSDGIAVGELFLGSEIRLRPLAQCSESGSRREGRPVGSLTNVQTPTVEISSECICMPLSAGRILLHRPEIDTVAAEDQLAFLQILADLAASVLANTVELIGSLDKVATCDRKYRELLDANTSLRQRTMIDELTGLHNRRYFERNITYELDRFRRYRTPLSLIIFDLDHFKAVNDTYGHAVGDLALCHVTQIAKNSIRTADVLARYGGEEFVILLPHTPMDGAIVTANRLLQRIATTPLESSEGPIQITVSAGIAAMVENTELTAREFFELADQGLYQAKESGRNRFVATQLAVPDHG